MRIVMMGTGEFAVPTFQHLHASHHQLLALVTRPVDRAGSRRKTPANPMRAVGEQLGTVILDPPSANAPPFVSQLRELRADLLVVCDYGQILAPECLDAARLGGVNLHGSLLPKYRGAAPVQWAVFHGEAQTGVTVIHMSPQLDAGPCLVQLPLRIEPTETADQLEQRLAAMGPWAITEAIEMLDRWDQVQPIGTLQDAKRATRAPRLKKTDGLINWTRTAVQLRDQIRAFQPWPGSFTHWTCHQGKTMRLILHRASVQTRDNSTTPPIGTVVAAADAELWIQTGHDCLAIEQLQPAGKRIMEVSEFLRGHAVRSGDRFE